MLRDIALTLFILGLLPFILARAWVGVLVWTWIGLMNPHKLTFGFARDFPFALIVGVATLVAILISSERGRRLPLTPVTTTLIAFVLWMSVTTLFALYPDAAWTQWNKVMKIQLMVFVTLLVMQSRERIQWMVWVTVGSLAFYGIKGGLYTLRGGGTGMVLGPPGGFIEGNTEISLAITIVVPLMIYLMTTNSRRWVRFGFGAAVALCAVAVIGSYSRGGLIAILAMGALLWLKSRKKAGLTLILVAIIPLILLLMPSEWYGRMATIQTYEQDPSAMGRINSWRFAINLANDHPFTGGGFDAFQKDAFQRWAPDPNDFHDSHSIWFQVLGMHGYVGLAIYLLLWWLTWRCANDIISTCKTRPDLRWAGDLAAMIQVALVGFWAGGSFLGLAYFDLPYILLALLVLTQRVVAAEIAKTADKPMPTDASESLSLGVAGQRETR
jgi:probable O-glycosylation ligase (exosortase A-associated)